MKTRPSKHSHSSECAADTKSSRPTLRLAALLTLLGATLAGESMLSGCGAADDSATVDVIGDINSVDATPPEAHAATRRMTVDMLQGSIPIVAGGDIRWTVSDGKATYDALAQTQLGGTLGRPDYYLVTSEPAQPDALYVKFMDDMARNVCNSMVQADAKAKSADARNLVRFATLDNVSDANANAANLRYLKLRLLGQYVADDDTAGVAELQALFDSLAKSTTAIPSGSTRALEAWRGVCIAILNSPSFHIY